MNDIKRNKILPRWDNKSTPRILIDEPKDNHDISPAASPMPTTKIYNTPEPPSPAPREIMNQSTKRNPIKDDKIIKDKILKDDKYLIRENSPNSRLDDKFINENNKDKKQTKKDKKKNKGKNNFDDPSSERIIIGGEDGMKNTMINKSRLPHEIIAQFEGKSREVCLLFKTIDIINLYKLINTIIFVFSRILLSWLYSYKVKLLINVNVLLTWKIILIHFFYV